ncbi:hypothetical protein [Rosistilla oblonga]|uniref:hypothetical protein n=1 Tax=Rosistilla oblonga TaxID=2527990 RepID=UPI003A980E77
MFGCLATIDWPAWISAVGSIISPLIALLIGWRLARRDSLRESRINACYKLSGHTQTIRRHYQRLEDEVQNNPSLTEDRKNDYLNQIAEASTLLNIDRMMMGTLFGAVKVRQLVFYVSKLMELTVDRGNLFAIDAKIIEITEEMRSLGSAYFKN